MRVLYVEDNALDADLTRRALRKTAPDIELEVVATISEALLRLRVNNGRDFDLVLTDLNLPDGEGLALYGQIRARGWPLPVVVITGLGDDATVTAALRAGASDYVVKRESYLDHLPATLRDAVERYQDERERQGQTLRVLYAEDDNETFELTARQFARQAPNIRLQRATAGSDVLLRLADVEPSDLPDVLLLDYQLPDQNGLDLLRALRLQATQPVPTVIITGHPEEEIALQAFKFGASDYLVKSTGYLTRLPRVLESVAYRAKLQREQEALHDSQARLEAAYAETRRQLADQRMLFECSQDLAEANTVDAVFRIVCDRMLTYVGATSVAIGSGAGDPGVTIAYHHQHADEANAAERDPDFGRVFQTDDFPHWAEAFRAGRIFQAFVDDAGLTPPNATCSSGARPGGWSPCRCLGRSVSWPLSSYGSRGRARRCRPPQARSCSRSARRPRSSSKTSGLSSDSSRRRTRPPNSRARPNRPAS
ncbi:MAG TPA: response regulator [Anaerolineales bacterium]|nr:response regulator [Anaerolineales bacterium]